MKIKSPKKVILLMAISLILFIVTSLIAANDLKLGDKEVINRILYGAILYLWATWMYVGKHRFYRFFMTFILIVYTFGFISFLFVPSFNLLAIIQIICAITGILINISTILVVRNERSKIANG
ncbi:hypothetical protein H5S40_06090 [Limosilactobacillus sp. RRLNB_1_1]|uniref:Integral membrane protein n=2 Tax=Limosilactobacillus albertensis TaxID=2759752 RepID=A0A7W3Y8H5_9LACO|nr:hypothetical protein [Limosilactobacillus albertensis]MBB1069719.1 hypothetical protein [Limosilactobacillus albertensis]MCD7117819.1 hypothetical protein [Limosilactobacillus albertensis]MCD7128471.1 hypothetical protein [Limosilactobacillus albertensis]